MSSAMERNVFRYSHLCGGVTEHGVAPIVRWQVEKRRIGVHAAPVYQAVRQLQKGNVDDSTCFGPPRGDVVSFVAHDDVGHRKTPYIGV